MNARKIQAFAGADCASIPTAHTNANVLLVTSYRPIRILVKISTNVRDLAVFVRTVYAKI